MRLVLFFVMAAMGFIAYLTHLNPERVTFFLTSETYINVSVISLILIAMSLGGFVVLMIGGIGELQNLVYSWRDQKEKKKDDKINGLYVNAINFLTAGNSKEAISYFKKILMIKPLHINSLVRLGNIYRQEGNLTEALRLLRKAKNISLENLEISFSIIDVLEEDLRYEEAEVAIHLILKENENNITAIKRMRDLLINKGKWVEAYEAQETLLNIQADEDENEEKRYLGLKYEVGEDYLKQGECENARKYFKEAIKHNKNFTPAYAGMADTFVAEGKRRNAVRYLEEAYKETGKLELLEKVENIYIELGEPERILSVYQEAVEVDPDNLMKKFLLGRLYFRLEMVDDAMEIFHAFSQEDRPDISVMLGYLYVRKGDMESAINEFKKIMHVKDECLFTCKACGRNSSQWNARCAKCGEWDTYFITPFSSKAASNILVRNEI